MDRLNLSLFGPFEAILNDQPVADFATDKVRSLLAYLAVEAGQPHRRETLAGLLWPEWPHQISLRNLRQSLHRLKQTLDNYQPDFSTQLLTITRQTVQLNPTHLQLDAAQFQTLLTTVERHAHPQLHTCQACLDRLRQAVALYRGEMLTGFSLADAPEFEAWLLVERERLHTQALTILDHLATAAEKSGDYKEAHRYARRQLALEPWREETHRQMMRLLALSGRRSEALTQYDACRRILAEELAVEPAPETTALYEAIRSGEIPGQLASPTIAPMGGLHNFPAELTPFIGRRRELQQITAQIAGPDCRLLTLSGPGGMGKTRLSIRAAEQIAESGSIFKDGLYFVSLAAVARPDLLASTLATALGLTLGEREPPRAQLLHYLSTKTLLLVLDNVEHLLADVSLLADILAAAPQVKLLLSSREPLNLRSEWRLPVEGLAYDAVSPTAQDDAVQLFLQTARQIQPGFQPTPAEHHWIAQICQSLQGIPLALEIAATWLRVYDLEKIAGEVAHNLDLLVTSLRDLPARHRSMRAVFEQSWQLLSPRERQLLAQASIFRGGFEEEAIQAVTGATPLDLADLVDKALLQTTAGGRYTMHELLRQFAAEKLAQWPAPAGEEDLDRLTGRQHSHYYLHWVAERRADLRRETAKQTAATLRRDLDNIRAAWQWAVDQADLELLLACHWGLYTFYEMIGLFEEGEALFRTAAGKFEQQLNPAGIEAQPGLPEMLCWLRQRQAQLLLQLGQLEEAQAVSKAAIDLGQQYGCSLPRSHAAVTFGRALDLQGEAEKARDYLEQALAFFNAGNDLDGQAKTLYVLGGVAWKLGLFDQALNYYRLSLKLGQANNNLYHQANCAGNIGSVYWWCKNDYEQALHWYEQALEYTHLLDYQAGIARWSGNTGLVYWKWGEYERSLDYQKLALNLVQALGDPFKIAIWQGNIGLLYADMGDDERALAYYDQALPVHRRLGNKFHRAEILQAKAELLFRQQDYASAQAINNEAIHLAADIGAAPVLFEGQILAAKLAFAAGQREEAIRHLEGMLASPDEAEQAALHYALWQLGQGQAHAQTALKLYQRLAGPHGKDIQYRRRIAELSAALAGEGWG